MIKKQNSEKIFLQPIDQNYDEQIYEENLRFCNDFDKMIDSLDMSTDSDSNGRKDSDDESGYKIENALKYHWKDNIENLKNKHMNFFQNMLFPKIAMFRNSLDPVKSRTYSCPSKVIGTDLLQINPFIRKSSDALPVVIKERVFNFFEEEGLS